MMEIATVRSQRQALAAQSIEEAFPDVKPLVEALGNQVLVQLRMPKRKTSGGIIVTDDSRETDATMIRVAKVLQVGPLAYRKRETLEAWPEGAWVSVGDYVRVPTFAGVDAWRQFWQVDGETEKSLFVKFALFNDYDIKGRVRGNPLDVVDYI